MKIRKAKPEDSSRIASLTVQAMEDMAFQFVGRNDLNEALELFKWIVAQKSNQYSFENCLVAIESNEITGSITAYDGSKLNHLRKPFLDHIREKYNYTKTPEDETEAGELYIDTVSVSADHQRKGIGRKLIEAIIEKAKAEGYEKVGLLVDVENPSANKLYQKIGFCHNGFKNLMGGKYEHLIFEIQSSK
ncbi:MAG: GNAT family N-acetyltransferase [Moheibacter sp.]